MHHWASPDELLRVGAAVLEGEDEVAVRDTSAVTNPTPLWPFRVVAYTGSCLCSVMVSCIGPFFAEHVVSQGQSTMAVVLPI